MPPGSSDDDPLLQFERVIYDAVAGWQNGVMADLPEFDQSEPDSAARTVAREAALQIDTIVREALGWPPR